MGEAPPLNLKTIHLWVRALPEMLLDPWLVFFV